MLTNLTSDQALAQSLIVSREKEDTKHEAKVPFMRITETYTIYEQWMLNNAVQTLNGCDILLVVWTDGTAIYRRKNQVAP